MIDKKSLATDYQVFEKLHMNAVLLIVKVMRCGINIAHVVLSVIWSAIFQGEGLTEVINGLRACYEMISVFGINLFGSFG